MPVFGKCKILTGVVLFCIGCAGATQGYLKTLDDPARVKTHDGVVRDLFAEPHLTYRSTPRCRARIDLGGEKLSGYVIDSGNQRWSIVSRGDGGGFCHRLHGDEGHFVVEIPDEAERPTHLLLRGMSQGFDDLEPVLNGVTLETVDFSENEFETVAIPLRDTPVRALNELVLKRSAMKEAEKKPFGLLLSEIALGFDDCLEAHESTVWSPNKGVLLDEGESIHFRAFVPDEAGLELVARSESGQGALELSFESDEGDKERQKVLFASDDATSRIDVASRFWERATALSLSARGGGVFVDSARLVSRRPGKVIEEPPPFPRHLFVVLVDTLRRDHIGAVGAFETPFAEDLRRASYVFERATAADSWTKPAVATILSGLYPRRHGAVTHEAALPADVTLLPQVLAQSGWATAAFSTNGYISPRFGFGKGFDEFRSLGDQEGRPERAAGAVDAVIDWLSGEDAERPHMVYLHLVDPHVPYDPPDEFLCPNAPNDCRRRLPPKVTMELVKAGSASENVVDEKSHRLLKRQYAAEVSYADNEIERLYRWLEAHGWLDDAVFVLTSDHGEEFAEHGFYGHGQSLHGELTDVPLFVSVSSDAPVSEVVREPFSMVDLMPTLLDLLGADAPDDIDGVSFFSPKRSGAAYAAAVLSESPSKARVAALSGRFKLIISDFSYKLYDLARDPGETEDVSQRYPIAFGALRDAVASFYNAHPSRAVESAAPAEGAKGGASENKTVLDGETLERLRALGYVD